MALIRTNPNSQLVPAAASHSSSKPKEESPGLQLSGSQSGQLVLDLEKGGGGGSGGTTSAVDYLARANWLRAAVLSAIEGLVSVPSLMIGVSTMNPTAKAMLATGLAGLAAGALSIATRQFVSVYAQYDHIEVAAQMERKNEEGGGGNELVPFSEEVKEDLRSLAQAGASVLAFVLGGVLPLLAGGFIRPWGVRVVAVCGVTGVGLAGLGAAGGFLGGASICMSAIRVLVGGWSTMALTYGASMATKYF